MDLVDAVAAVLESIDPQIRQSVAGDIVSTRALSLAARTIQVENIAEMRAAPTDF